MRVIEKNEITETRNGTKIQENEIIDEMKAAENKIKTENSCVFSTL
jgi:hypothetical protein